MLKTSLRVFVLLSLTAAGVANADLTDDVATVMEFQIALGKGDEAKAMSFLAPEVQLIWNSPCGETTVFSGIEQVRQVYFERWFSKAAKLLSLDEANFRHLRTGEIVYSFKGVFSMEDKGFRKNSPRESTSFFNVENGKIVKISRLIVETEK